MKAFRFSKEFILLSLLFFFALFLRTYNLSTIPPGLHGDEASIGYNAYSLLKTAKDQNGNFLPIAIDQFGDFRPAGYHYLDIPFVAVLGLNAWAVRLPAAIFGALCVLVFFYLLRELFKNKAIAWIGAIFLTISPWHLIISRASSESVIAAFFVLLGLLLTSKALKRKNSLGMMILGFAMFFMSFLFYHAARFFVPPFVLLFLLISIFQYKIEKRKIIQAAVLYLSLIIFFFSFFVVGKGTSRPLNVSLLNVPGGSTEVKQQTDEDGTQNPLISRFFHNKAYFYNRVFLSSYFMHLSGEFLFVGNGNPVRYKVPWSSNMYLIDLPFLVFGFAVLLTEGIKKKKYIYLLPVGWILLAALPGGLTWEDIPNIQRASFMVPALLIISAFGVYEAIMLVKKKFRTAFFALVFVFLLINTSVFFHNYFYHMRIHEPWNRSASEPELIASVTDLSKKFSQVIMTTDRNNNLIFYLFYNKFDPKEFQKMGSPKEFDGLHFLNFLYTHSPCPIEGDPEVYAKEQEGIIFVDRNDCVLPKNTEVLNLIRTPDGSPSFKIVKITKIPKKL